MAVEFSFNDDDRADWASLMSGISGLMPLSAIGTPAYPSASLGQNGPTAAAQLDLDEPFGRTNAHAGIDINSAADHLSAGSIGGAGSPQNLLGTHEDETADPLGTPATLAGASRWPLDRATFAERDLDMPVADAEGQPALNMVDTIGQSLEHDIVADGIFAVNALHTIEDSHTFASAAQDSGETNAIAEPTATPQPAPVLSSFRTDDDPSGFDIEVMFSGDWTADLQSEMVDAVGTAQSVIAGDLINFGAFIDFKLTWIDDLLIFAELVPIDGPGGILGQAGPLAVRMSNQLPAIGLMQFDTADAAQLDALPNDEWGQVLLHELLHVLGVGTLWNAHGLLSGVGTGAPRYIGEGASLEYGRLLGFETPVNVPVEEEGLPGTVFAHWDEETFDNEIATGYLQSGLNPFSAMTAASLGDLGYELADQAAWEVDPYILPLV